MSYRQTDGQTQAMPYRRSQDWTWLSRRVAWGEGAAAGTAGWPARLATGRTGLPTRVCPHADCHLQLWAAVCNARSGISGSALNGAFCWVAPGPALTASGDSLRQADALTQDEQTIPCALH